MDPKDEKGDDGELREEDVRIGDRLDDQVSEDDADWPGPEPKGTGDGPGLGY